VGGFSSVKRQKKGKEAKKIRQRMGTFLKLTISTSNQSKRTGKMIRKEGGGMPRKDAKRSTSFMLLARLEEKLPYKRAGLKQGNYGGASRVVVPAASIMRVSRPRKKPRRK